jgi:RimJ/RimL family protein N-acetyltransferase
MRPVCAGDVEHIQSGINDRRVSDNLSYMSNPYTMEMAEIWTRNVNFGMANGSCCYWTICDKKTGKFIGSIGISIHKEQEGCELHYWINADEWNRGYCTEAAKRIVTHVFEELHMHRLFVTHRERNIASKTVIGKCGFVLEGVLRESLKRFGKFENVVSYSMLQNEYLALKEKGVY